MKTQYSISTEEGFKQWVMEYNVHKEWERAGERGAGSVVWKHQGEGGAGLMGVIEGGDWKE